MALGCHYSTRLWLHWYNIEISTVTFWDLVLQIFLSDLFSLSLLFKTKFDFCDSDYSAVTISDEPETITPSQTPNFEPAGSSSPRPHRASVSGKRLSGRASVSQSTMSLASLSSQISNFKLDSPSQDDDATEASEAGQKGKSIEQKAQAHASDLLGQVFQWLQTEKSKRGKRKFRKADVSTPKESEDAVSPLAIAKDAAAPRKRSDSDVSDGAVALDKLERILAEFAASGKEGASSFLQSHKPPVSSRRGSLFKKTRKGSAYASSDTDYVDGDVLVPSADVWLDNTKTMAYTGGTSGSEVESVEDKKKDKEHWVKFKREIVRLTHTLKLKGWRKLPIERGEEIDVERLSGALTNAVYVVAPPRMMPEPTEGQNGEKVPRPRKPPP
jgi:choline kinase